MAKKQPLADSHMLPPFLLGTDKRTVILRAAHKLFLCDGFSATSMDAITQEAGVSKATVYAHYDSKEKLFETLIRSGSENALAMTPSLIRSGGDPRRELLTFFDPFLMLLFGSGGYSWSRLLIVEANRHPEIAELFCRCTIERITTLVEGYLGELATEGLFPTGRVRLASEALVSMILLGPLHKTLLLGPGSVDVQASLHFGIDLLLGNHSR
jgi:AcrR family transcriptional regulator